MAGRSLIVALTRGIRRTAITLPLLEKNEKTVTPLVQTGVLFLGRPTKAMPPSR